MEATEISIEINQEDLARLKAKLDPNHFLDVVEEGMARAMVLLHGALPPYPPPPPASNNPRTSCRTAHRRGSTLVATQCIPSPVRRM